MKKTKENCVIRNGRLRRVLAGWELWHGNRSDPSTFGRCPIGQKVRRFMQLRYNTNSGIRSFGTIVDRRTIVRPTSKLAGKRAKLPASKRPKPGTANRLPFPDVAPDGSLTFPGEAGPYAGGKTERLAIRPTDKNWLGLRQSVRDRFIEADLRRCLRAALVEGWPEHAVLRMVRLTYRPGPNDAPGFHQADTVDFDRRLDQLERRLADLQRQNPGPIGGRR